MLNPRCHRQKRMRFETAPIFISKRSDIVAANTEEARGWISFHCPRFFV